MDFAGFCDELVKTFREPMSIYLKWHKVKALGQAAEAARAYLTAARPELKPGEMEDALFISQKGGRITRQAVWQRIHRVGVRADLPCKLTPRVLRNTAAYRLRQAGYPVREIRRRLGHRSLRSTQLMLERLASCVSC